MDGKSFPSDPDNVYKPLEDERKEERTKKDEKGKKMRNILVGLFLWRNILTGEEFFEGGMLRIFFGNGKIG